MDEEESDPKNSTSNSFSKFKLGGATLHLPNVSSKDSLMYRIESLRMFLEDKLGFETFIKIYHLLNDNNANNNNNNGSDPSIDEQIGKILNEEQMPLLSLIHQLIFCEDCMYDS